MVCFSPLATGAGVAAGAAVVATGAAVCWGFPATVGDAVGAGVAGVFVVSVPVQPATNIAKMSNAARLNVAIKYELLLAFMVFYQEFHMS
jgi:hypothetical protein